MNVCVDQPGHQRAASGVDDFGTPRHAAFPFGKNALDLAVDDDDYRIVEWWRAGAVDEAASANNQKPGRVDAARPFLVGGAIAYQHQPGDDRADRNQLEHSFSFLE